MRGQEDASDSTHQPRGAELGVLGDAEVEGEVECARDGLEQLDAVARAAHGPGHQPQSVLPVLPGYNSPPTLCRPSHDSARVPCCIFLSSGPGQD